ncbi:hypothetical protein LX36DRAFT_656079 [Colletotrichum falcatum]|nr:hypothetical protein LX36DRAFT_656079 [Colletotrichum falcatum]
MSSACRGQVRLGGKPQSLVLFVVSQPRDTVGDGLIASFLTVVITRGPEIIRSSSMYDIMP